jgi:hypothetical protein
VNMVLFVSYPFDKRRMCLFVMDFLSCEIEYCIVTGLLTVAH